MIAYASAVDTSSGVFSLRIWDGEAVTIVTDDLSRSLHFSWSADGSGLRFLNCEFFPAIGSTECRGSAFSQLVDFSPDGRTILQIDKDKLCLIPIENDCVETPKILKSGWLRVIGWRP